MNRGDLVRVKVSRDRVRMGTVTDISPKVVFVEFDRDTGGIPYEREQILSTEPVSAATKYDNDKPRLDLIPPEAIIAVGKAMTFGAKKYEADNWANGFEWRRLIGAALRHITAFNRGEDNDPESGISHLGHAIACLSMLEAHLQGGLGNDDRRKTIS